MSADTRTMFDAIGQRDGAGVLRQTVIFLPLIAAVAVVAAVAAYAKLTLQRRWRAWLNAHVLDQWLTSGRYYQLNLVPGDHSNPEYRVAEDLRLSVDGAGRVHDQALRTFGRSARLLSKFPTRRRARKA